jgi:hypothetical protein
VHLIVQPTQPVAQLLAYLRVERAERLVEQEHLGLDRECAGERHALPLPTGQLRRITIGELIEVDELEEFHDAPFDLVLRALANRQAERHVLEHGHVLERGVVLEDEPDVAVLRRQLGRVGAGDLDDAVVGVFEAGDDAQQRRLPAAARTKQRRERSARDLEIHVVDGGKITEVFGDVANGDAHQVRSFGRRKLRSRSARIAVTARTMATVYAPC